MLTKCLFDLHEVTQTIYVYLFTQVLLVVARPSIQSGAFIDGRVSQILYTTKPWRVCREAAVLLEQLA